MSLKTPRHLAAPLSYALGKSRRLCGVYEKSTRKERTTMAPPRSMVFGWIQGGVSE